MTFGPLARRLRGDGQRCDAAQKARLAPGICRKGFTLMSMLVKQDSSTTVRRPAVVMRRTGWA